MLRRTCLLTFAALASLDCGDASDFSTGSEHSLAAAAFPDLARPCTQTITGAAWDGVSYYVSEAAMAGTAGCIGRYDDTGALVEVKTFFLGPIPVDPRGLHFVPASGRLVTRRVGGALVALDYAAGTAAPLSTFNPDTPNAQSAPAADPDGITYWRPLATSLERRTTAGNVVVTSFPVSTGGTRRTVAVSDTEVFVVDPTAGINVYDKAGAFLRNESTTASPLGCSGFGLGAAAAGDRLMYGLSCAAVRVETIGNDPPDAEAGGPYFGVEGSAVAFEGAATDPDVGDTLTAEWTFGDPNTSGGGTAAGTSVSHTYADNGSPAGSPFAVTFTVTDQDGASDISMTTATIANAAPAVNAGDDASVVSGQPFALSASFTDPGVLDAPWSYTIDWGDGSASAGSTSAQGALADSHLYLDAGSYTVTVSVTDKDGDTGSDSMTLTVERLSVAIDIIPGKTPNFISLNPHGGGFVSVAILTGGGFNAADVDVATVTLGDGTAPDVPVARRGRHLFAVLVDVDRDGDKDLLVSFDRAALLAGGDLTRDTTSLVVTGSLTSGVQFVGSDSVRPIVHRGHDGRDDDD